MNSIVQRSMNRARSAFGIFPVLHAIEMRAQPIESLVAEIELRLHPLLHLFEAPFVEAVDPRRGFGAIGDEAALAQHLEMARDRRSRHVETAGDVAGVSLLHGEHRHDLAARRIGKGLEGIHASCLAYRLYSWQAK